MIRLEPQLRDTETYTESNFLRVHTSRAQAGGERVAPRLVTIEHLSYRAGGEERGWQCLTIVDGEAMSKEDALFIAQAYAQQNQIPVIYECHAD